MKHIKQAFVTRMAQKHMAHMSIGAFLVEKVKSYVQYPTVVTGYIRWNVLSLTLSPRENKAKLFMEKQCIVTELNKHLQEFGYTYVLKDIRL